MKNYNPSKRETMLVLALKYDTEVHKHFTTGQRIVINQERAALMSGSEYIQSEELKSKIEFVFQQIISTRWHRENPIEYV